ncbi:MAG: c-type cytochrome [Nevskiaceae bacterium]|jgi:cytochrome c553|nr:c-type cytochrome [Nevskiaceae bacterium]
MKLRLITPAAALLLFCAGAAALAVEVQDLRSVPAITGDAQAGATKAALCVACHGPDGHSMVAAFPALAGQNATYNYQQMLQYQSGQRVSAVMAPFLASLSDADLRDIAAYFAAQAARPANAAASAQATETGRKLYVDGDPARGIPSCQGCHGVNGVGMQPAGPNDRVPWHSFPTLAGQQGDYVAQQLRAYKEGARGGTTSAVIMQEVAKTLDDAAMQAVAAYIAAH